MRLIMLCKIAILKKNYDVYRLTTLFTNKFDNITPIFNTLIKNAKFIKTLFLAYFFKIYTTVLIPQKV